METSPGWVTEEAIVRALGSELRRAREAAGWTRADLVARLPFEMHVQTLTNYERGLRQCTLGRLVEICRALDLTAPDVLRVALQRAEMDVHAVVQVDLRAAAEDSSAEFVPLQRWARNRLATEPAGVVRLGQATIKEMAAVMDVPPATLTKRLSVYGPGTAT